MKTSEAIIKYADAIKSEMVNRYRTVLECDGRIQYKIYVWDDGEIEVMECVPGDNSYLVPKSAETRQLFHVCTVSEPNFDPWDCADHSAPEDEDERESERAEIIDYLMRDYEDRVSDILDATLDGTIQGEEYDGE